MNLSGRQRDLLKRYGLAVALAALALAIRGALPVPTGTTIYQLPLAAVVLAGWFGGRGPGVVALLICAAGILYWFLPPTHSFRVLPEYQLGLVLFVSLGLLLAEFSGTRRRVEQALRESEERFRALVQFSFDVYWESDAQHRFTRQEFSERLTDAPPRQSEIGKTRWEIPYVEPDEDAWRQHKATLDAHQPFRDFELARPTDDGGRRWVSVSGIPAFNAAGRFAGYRGVGRHITERKLAEEEHRAHLWFLESLDRINRAIQVSNDLDRMTSDVLEAALDIFGCDRAWLVHPCDPDAASWHAVMEHTKPEYPGAFAETVDQPVDDEVAAVFSAARTEGGAVVFGPGAPLPLPPRAAERFAIRSQIAMTLDAKVGAPYLFGLHQCSHARIWTLAERRLFEEIGRRFADALTSLAVFRSLWESERKLEAAQRIAKLGWWERDLATQSLSFSEEVQRIFGIAPADLPARQDRWLDRIHPDDQPRVAAASAAALAGTARYDVEYRVIRPDGDVRVVHSQGDVTRDASGRPLRQFGVLQDITERRQAEDELSEVKEHYRVLAESSLTGTYVATEDAFVYANPAMAQMFGYSVEEIVGGLRSVDLTCPEDRPLVAENMRRRLSGAVEELRYEFRGLRKDGSVFPVEVYGRRIEHAGKSAVLGTIVDNTERRRAEDELRASELRFRTLVDHATDAFFLLDDELKIVDVNRQACEGLGWSREELIGKQPGHFDVALDAASIAKLAQRAQAGEIITFETRHKRKDGTVFPVEIRTGHFRREEKLFSLALARDITERKLAEESLRQSEAYLTEAQRLSHTGSWALDVATNRYVYTSEEFDRLFGFDPQAEAPTRETVLERMHPDDRISWKRILEKSVGEKLDTTSEYRIVLPDGRVRHIHTIRHPVVDSTGKVVKLVGTSIDITERKHAEKELRASEARFRTLVDHAADAFFLIDDTLRVVDVNRRACESLGYSRDELIGMHPRDFDAALDDSSIGGLADRARAGETLTFETVHRRKDGSTFAVEIRSHMFVQGGKDYHLALVRDITDRKRAEESLRQSEAYLADAQRLSQTGSWALDVATHRYIYTSEESDRMWGFDPRGEKPSRQAVSERVHPEDRNRWKRNLDRSLREKVDTFDEYRIVLPDGTVRHLRTIRHPVLDSAGEVVKLVGTSIDITERKRGEEERERLRRLEAELAHANRLTTMGELTASIAHEVNQPLGAMVANAAACTRWLAAEPPETVKARRALDSIAADGRRASEIIGRIRAHVKHQAPRKDSIEVNVKIEQVIELAADEIRRNGIVLRTELAEGLPRVQGDRVQLQQVLLNLILNAIDAMIPIQDRPREMTIVSRRDDADAVLVEVRDAGPGIDPEHAAQVFEPFYTTKPHGLGIGLSISRSIVEAHGGKLWVQPNSPQGAIFRFSLPGGEAAS